MSEARDGRPLSSVLGKAVAILRAFGPDDQTLRLAELAGRTGLHRATAHRLCTEMVDHRLLDRVPGGYRLSGGLFELGMRAAAERSLLELAMPFMQDLYARTHETVHLGVRDGVEVVYVAKIGGHRQARSPSRVGGRMPMHCTAIGKALLAFGDSATRRAVVAGPLERRTVHTVVASGLLQRRLRIVQETGIAFEHEESALGLTCLAAPVLERDVAVAAISVAGPTSRFRPEQHVEPVRAVAAALGSVMSRRA